MLLTHPILLEFGAGLLLAEACRNGALSRLGFLLPLGVLALCIGSYIGGPRVVVYGIPACAIVAGALALEGGTRRSTLKLLGDASYSIYLMHPLVLFVLRRVIAHVPLGGWLGFTLFITLALSGSIIAGLIVHRFVEKPLARLLTRKRPLIGRSSRGTTEQSSLQLSE
ncbi:acyltransferase family protein [Sphingomonas sp. LR60]|uniref:acyltransferase family protein n=1 Tax=Sphingomonas sp. LR60 TaxID=3050233 RepID=UPI002FE2B514